MNFNDTRVHQRLHIVSTYIPTTSSSTNLLPFPFLSRPAITDSQSGVCRSTQNNNAKKRKKEIWRFSLMVTSVHMTFAGVPPPSFANELFPLLTAFGNVNNMDVMRYVRIPSFQVSMKSACKGWSCGKWKLMFST